MQKLFLNTGLNIGLFVLWMQKDSLEFFLLVGAQPLDLSLSQPITPLFWFNWKP
jgi:hypothetical protein